MVSGRVHRAVAPRRVKWLVLLALATALLHAGLLGGFARAGRGATAPAEPAALQVRLLVAAPADELPAPAALPADRPDTPAATPLATVPAPRRTVPPRPAKVEAAALPATPVAVAEPLPVPADHASEAPGRKAVDPVLAALALAPDESLPEPGADMAPAILPPQGDRPVPALPAPALTVDYDLRRGLMRGSAELRWQPHEGSYDLQLDARVAGFSVLHQSSQGDLGEGGLAPRRFTDQRAGREVRATNFQREIGKITFSGPPVAFRLDPGTQDRLSWMLQLAAVVAADTHRREPGGEVGMLVVGARADLATWVFRYVGDETIETALGPVAAAKFVRLRHDDYDTEVEVWLDPLRHHLPARAVLRSGPDDVLELLLRRVS